MVGGTLAATPREEAMATPTRPRSRPRAGRMRGVPWLLRWALVRGDGGRVVRFALHVRNDDREGPPPLVRLKAVCGPGDQGEPVLTVMLPDED
jgi:hypothetical protein